MATLVPVLLIIQQSINAGDLVFNWKGIGMAAIAGFVGYLLKNFFTDGTKEAVKTLTNQDATIITKNNMVINPTPEIKRGDIPEIK